MLTQVADLSLEPGVLEGQRCQKPDCTGCGEVEIEFGSTNLGPCVDYLELIPVVLAGQNMTELCFELEGKTVIDEDDDDCYYEAAALSLNQPDNGPIFAGSNSESTWRSGRTRGSSCSARPGSSPAAAARPRRACPGPWSACSTPERSPNEKGEPPSGSPSRWSVGQGA
ncbi:hypothetical protein [Plesiocystis pacifica]|uniref:hypothetical protein n=1 Tax=Plesiocystis pacifica TaxID=191768 RepID=UPI0005D46E8E|nr:hypothetical protein [Plesiocystis pacifica]